MIGRCREECFIFLQALQFLTRIPLPSEVGYTPQRLAAAPRYYPLVGLLIGSLSALVYVFAAQRLNPMLAALLATAASVLATGAFHEDGFADACDGLGGAVSREKALEIMKDSRLGTYGAVGLGLLIATKVVALASVHIHEAVILLVSAHAISRASSVAVIATSRYVRDHGTAKPVASGVSRRGLVVALATGAAALAACCFLLGPPTGLAALGGLLLGHGLMRQSFESKLGGYTGDCLGAIQQISEAGFYLGALAWL
jgi:adenosylcobinamide-GDP ribazoletransferase